MHKNDDGCIKGHPSFRSRRRPPIRWSDMVKLDMELLDVTEEQTDDRDE